jgi:ribosomal subunit interface protein
MQVQVHTDNHIEGSAKLSNYLTSVVESTLERFADRITRVEVHLSDESSAQKSAGDDKRCRMEARVSGLQPIAVSADAPTVDQAIDGAAEKLEKALSRTLEKLSETKGRTSFAGDQTV